MSNLAILTATRAEWGLLRPIVHAIQARGVEVRVLVTGMHLPTTFGNTSNEVCTDGAPVDATIPILVDSDSPSGASKTMALAMSGFADYFARRRPDALLVLGDRYETLAVCCAALNERIPIFHLYGGETTEGAIDEAVRHAITKMSWLHFTSTETYRKRVIQLGEDPARVFNVGAIGVENALTMDLMSHEQLEESLGTTIKCPYAVMTYHPVTLESESPVAKLEALLAVVARHPEITFVATKANADAGGRAINAKLGEFAVDHGNLLLFDSLGSLRYLSALKDAAFVIGNSSSGLLEAPAFGVPTVNIGARQRGRVRPASVIDCAEDVASIEDAVVKALSTDFRSSLLGMENPYGAGSTSELVASVISDVLGRSIDLRKKFYDIDFGLGEKEIHGVQG